MEKEQLRDPKSTENGHNYIAQIVNDLKISNYHENHFEKTYQICYWIKSFSLKNKKIIQN